MVKLQAIGKCVLAGLLLWSCSPAGTNKTAEKKPVPAPVPVSGLTGLYRCFGPARTWSPDVQILRVQSIAVDSIKAEPGKAAVWRVTFASAAKARLKNYTYSVIEGEGFHEGVFPAGEESWSGPSKILKPFVIQAVKKDTDEILKIAKENSKDYVKKNPNSPITMLLEWTDRTPTAAWRVIWGTSVGNSAYSVFIDPTNGTYLSKAF
jgi:hypothetical protein